MLSPGSLNLDDSFQAVFWMLHIGYLLVGKHIAGKHAAKCL